MFALLPEIVKKLQQMASTNASVPQLLREAIKLLPSDQRGSLYLIIYFREAFHLSLKSASPIGGWSESGNGEISDERIEEFLRPEMLQTRQLWTDSELS